MSFNADTATAHVIRLMRENGYRVSVFHNPGSLLGTVAAFVECHAVLDEPDPPHVHVMRVYVADHQFAEYVCVCRLAESCGFSLE